MTKLGHYATSFAVAVAVRETAAACSFSSDALDLYLAVFVLSSWLPDLDIRLGGMEFHRGPTHSVLVNLVLPVLCLLLPVEAGTKWLLLSISLSCLLHVLMDSLSVSGVPLFFSKKGRKLKAGVYVTGRFSELVTVVVFSSLMIAVTFLARKSFVVCRLLGSS